MDKSRLNDWLQLGASVGVILSLVFVGLEIQQSREIAIADIYQQRAALAIEVQTGMMSNYRLLDIFGKAGTGTITDSELRMLNFSNNPWLSYYENNHFQYQVGMLSAEQWVSSRNSLERMVNRKYFGEWWETQRSSWRKSFAAEVDSLIKDKAPEN